tara:strand:+ start:1825 stop:2445 length:621 start_codon:yes stop_codon:yes gene_type:complete
MSRTGDWFMRVHGDNDDDDGYDRYTDELELAKAEEEFKARERAEQHILNVWTQEALLTLESIDVAWKDRDCVDELVYKDYEFHNAIWHASTEILPNLEVQVVIDGQNNCYVTTGSPGYVEFGMQPPIGMKLPIRCWIHTHPFGSAYFSGVDIKTVSQWKPLMTEAYVLGGEGHFGYWHQDKPKQLKIYKEFNLERIQDWNKGEEEE